MEVLSPSPPPSPAVDRYGGAASPTALRLFLQRRRDGVRVGPDHSARPSPAEAKLYVAVGRSPEKTLGLLRWAFRRFGCKEIGLLHVHQPSPVIPTLLGKIPVNQANEEVVSYFRRAEKEETKKILLDYLNYCQRAQVQANVVVTETEQIHSGIVDLVAQHGITKLVMGSTTENCFKLKASKSAFTAKKAPPFCEIWFVSKGRHVWTREASQATEPFLSAFRPNHSVMRERFQSNTPNHIDELIANREHNEQDESNDAVHSSPEPNRKMILYNLQEPTPFPGAGSWPSSPSHSQDELDIEELYEQLKEVTTDIESSKKAAFAELVKRRQVESEVAEALSRVKASEAAQEQEIRIRKGLEDQLKTTKLQHKELLDKTNKSMRELQNITENIAILDSHIREVALRRHDAAGELELIQSRIEGSTHGRQKIDIQGQKDDGQFDRLESNSVPPSSSIQLVGFNDDLCSFREFTLSDLQAATCEFAESFKICEGGFGCVYKGELMNRTVMIKKLHPHNVRGQMEFQQEVHILGKLRHPHLLTLVGMCPEAWSLVYEYTPNGTLHHRIFQKTMTPLTWKIRTRIIAEISSALLFLHSSKPEKIVHGQLKPENILLDSNFTCKIVNFGIHGIPGKDAGQSSLFHLDIDRQGALALPYADPEYPRSKELTTKSDVYSLGIIILQLLTAKPTVGGELAGEVRRALLSGSLPSVLDPAAGEWPIKVARSLAEFGLQFCEAKVRDRPELTPEIVKELGQLHLMKEIPVPSFFLCPILQEIMHDPQVAADGFTYEGRALREWFGSGRDTSPMTNLKLKHTGLTPNHGLRFAIQDWLCQS